jgi:hypothetical protein
VSAKIYDLAAYRQLRADVEGTRELLSRPRPWARQVSWCCTRCHRPGHNRRTCKAPKREPLAHLVEVRQ